MFPPTWTELHSLWPSGPPSTLTHSPPLGRSRNDLWSGQGQLRVFLCSREGAPGSEPAPPLVLQGEALPVGGLWSSRELCPVWGFRARKHPRAWVLATRCSYPEHRCHRGLQLLTPLSSLLIVQNLGGKKGCYLWGPQRPQEAWAATIETMRLEPCRASRSSLKGLDFIPRAVKVFEEVY